jgi:P27 family predicted phage terminase small subunit
MAGRKIIPMEEKKAKGTYRPHRDKGTPETSSKKPHPPEWMTKRAKQIFHLLTKRLGSRASATYTEVQALCASRMDEVERFDKILNEAAYVYITANSFGDQVMKPRPEVSMRKEAMRHVQSLLAELGLTMTAAHKVGAPQGKKKGNEFDGF